MVVTLKDLHWQHDPGILQVGDVQIPSRVASQTDVQHSERARSEGVKTLKPDIYVYICFMSGTSKSNRSPFLFNCNNVRSKPLFLVFVDLFPRTDMFILDLYWLCDKQVKLTLNREQTNLNVNQATPSGGSPDYGSSLDRISVFVHPNVHMLL